MKPTILTIALIFLLTTTSFAWQSKAVRKANDFIAANMISEAIQSLENGIQEEPKDHEAHWMLGKLYLERGAYSSADARFKSAVLLKPSHKSELGRVYKQTTDIALSKGEFQKVKTLHSLASNHERSISIQIEEDVYNLGETALQHGQEQASAKYFDLLVSLSSIYKDKISDLYFSKSQYDFAAHYSKKHNSDIHAEYLTKMKASSNPEEYNKWREKALQYGDVIDYILCGPGKKKCNYSAKKMQRASFFT